MQSPLSTEVGIPIETIPPRAAEGYEVVGGPVCGAPRGTARHTVRLALRFAAREIAVRYRQTWFGVAWACVQPILLVALATWIVNHWLEIEAGRTTFVVEVWIGLVVWNFFCAALAAAIPCFVGQADLVKKMWFPRAALPLGIVLGAGIDFALGLALGLVLLPTQGISPSPHMLLLPLWLLPVFLFTVACAVLGSALNVRWRDVKHGLPLLLQAGFFLTPVVYPLEQVPAGWRAVLGSLPPAASIDAMRAAVAGTWPHMGLYAAGLGLGLGLLLVAQFVLGRLAPHFADEL